MGARASCPPYQKDQSYPVDSAKFVGEQKSEKDKNETQKTQYIFWGRVWQRSALRGLKILDPAEIAVRTLNFQIFIFNSFGFAHKDRKYKQTATRGSARLREYNTCRGAFVPVAGKKVFWGRAFTRHRQAAPMFETLYLP